MALRSRNRPDRVALSRLLLAPLASDAFAEAAASFVRLHRLDCAGEVRDRRGPGFFGECAEAFQRFSIKALAAQSCKAAPRLLEAGIERQWLS